MEDIQLYCLYVAFVSCFSGNRNKYVTWGNEMNEQIECYVYIAWGWLLWWCWVVLTCFDLICLFDCLITAPIPLGGPEKTTSARYRPDHPASQQLVSLTALLLSLLLWSLQFSYNIALLLLPTTTGSSAVQW